ncbi:hypothetical protein C1H46_002726 [Malus baccata]|uniref:Uncharacterized protein n=1 Tax=Malus baccata TaxID=106549 RepID=A0A540NMD7_MALBA|nr:hypothetical protein C1H46_002726 [Malus baccata]
MNKCSIDHGGGECFIPRSIGAQNKHIRLCVTVTGPLCENSKKAEAAAAIFQSSEEDVDLCKQFGNDRESMWLSSDCPSPSAFFREYRWFDSFHSNELLLPSWLPLLARTNPMEEASSLHIDRRDEDNNLHECSPSCRNSSTPLDFERIGCLFSLLNLDGNDYKLTPGTDSRSDCCLIFPAHLTKVHDFQSSNSSVSEAEDLEDLTTTDEPLFWPFERKTDRNSEETWNYFSMSPRKGMCNSFWNSTRFNSVKTP